MTAPQVFLATGEPELDGLRHYDAKVNGRDYVVAIQTTESGGFRMSIGGKVFEVERVRSAEDATWSLRSGERTIRTHTRILEDGIVEAWVAGIPFPISVGSLATARIPVQTQTTQNTQYGGKVHALMPGRVTSVLVKENDRVEIGSPLLILEAMKMQNEISSPVVGGVKSIRVKEGETVKKDALLVEIG